MRIAVANQTFSRNQTLRRELLSAFPDCVFNDDRGHLGSADLARLLAGCDGAVVGLERVDDALLRLCPRLRIVSKYGVGLDNVDLKACARRGVAVGWSPGLNRLSVAELTLGLMLSLLRHIVPTCQALKAGRWEKTVGAELSGKTVGVVGVGNVGQELIRLLKPFRCRILANDIADRRAFLRRHGCVAAGKDRIWRESDLVTLHTPLTPLTRGIVGARVLARMKPTAYLVNTARGLIVDIPALKRALRKGSISGAALDVYPEEPCTDRGLLALPNLLCLPHRAGSSREAVLAMGRSAIVHLRKFFRR